MSLPRPAARTWVELLSRAAQERPEQVAFGFLSDGETLAGQLSYARLDQRARAIGARLRDHGLAGRPVLLVYPPGLEYVTAFFGCLYAGAVAVPAYPPSRRPRSLERIVHIINDCGAAAALTTAHLADGAGAELAAAIGLDLLATDSIPAGDAGAWAPPRDEPGAPAFLQYTSGSTGQPRGVVVSHRNLLANAATTQRLFGASPDTRVVSWLPVYHDMGLIGSVLGTVHCGGSCTLMSPVAFIQRPGRWLEAISRTRATASGAPDFAYEMCVRQVTAQERDGLDLSHWEVAFDGAEPIRPQTLRRFAQAFAPCGFRPTALTPCYGLAEATLLVTAKRFGTAARTDTAPPGEGRPVVSCGEVPDEHRLRIVDPQRRRPRPDGEIGEIWVASASVADGYHGRPAESAERFGASLHGEPGQAYLRTGDLGYLRAGELHVVGRIKDLIIVRGRNHYPQDIEETAESAHPALHRGGGAAFSLAVDGAEELVLVHELDRGYRGDAREPAEAAHAAIAAEHGVRPHAVVLIRAGGLPRTSSGKPRRRACREQLLAGELPELCRTAPAQDPGPVLAGQAGPRGGGLAGILRAELARLLGEPSVPDDQPLISLGLDSLGTLHLQQRIQDRFGRHLDFEDVAGCTVAELAGRLESGGPAGAGPAAGPEAGPAAADQPAAGHPGPGHAAPDRQEDGPDPAGITGQQDTALPEKQRSQWIGHQLAPRSRRHVIAAAVAAHGPLDTGALERALRTTARAHPALHTVFRVVDGQPVQRTLPGLPPGFSRHDCAGWTAKMLRTELEKAAYQPFDLEHGPLLRLAVFSAGPEEHRLVVAVHHLVADLWSLELLLADLDRNYQRERDGGAPPGAPPGDGPGGPGPAAAQRRSPAQTKRLLAYWRAELAGAPATLPLPVRPPAVVRRFDGDAVRVSLSPELTAALTALASAERTTPYTVLMAAWQVLLGSLAGTRDLLVAAPVHGRDDPADAGRIGLLADVMPIRGRLAAGESFRDLLRRTHQTIRAALRHADISFPLLVEWLNPEREPGRQALTQAVLTLHRPVGPLGELISACALGLPGGRGVLGGLSLESVEFTPPPSQFELGLSLAEIGGGLSGLLHFDSDLFDRDTAARWAAEFVQMVTALVRSPGAPAVPADPASAAPAPAAPEPSAGPAPRPVHEQFAGWAAAAPDRTAVVAEDGSLSYRELEVRANRLAHRLRDSGVGPETLVALCLPRGADLVVAVLAVAKAGGAYLPLDPAHPADRMAYILGDAGPAVIIANEATASRLPRHDAGRPDPELIVTGDSEISSQPASPPDVPGALDRLAYVIYTSGSSGRPKGVLVEHRGVANIFAAAAAFRFDHTDVWTLFHSCAFDFSVWELWGPLVHGGTLVVVPWEATVSPPALWELVRRHRVTVLSQTPAVFAGLTSACPDQLAGLGLRHIIFGGEKLEPSHLATWRRHGDPRTRLTNMYGITEITVHATCQPLEEDRDGTGPVSLGMPLSGTDLRLAGPDGGDIPPGEAGEICIGGAGVARGYLNRPALTAERFVPHPERPGGRMYRSGDLARTDRDGRLLYLGRLDDQVKIRGHRIEPGEIAAALETCPGVAQAVVVPWTDGGQTRLAAYLVPVPPDAAGPAPAGLRAHLRERLPEYLVPGSFTAVPAIPLTANGKVDRRALPAPAAPPPGRGASPATEAEEAIGGFVAEMLAVDAVGCDDDLFALGWHSLLMARLGLRVEERFGVRIPLQTLFTEPTVRRIAAAVDEGRTGTGPPRAAAAGAVTRADRSRYTARRRSDGTLALPDALAPRARRTRKPLAGAVAAGTTPASPVTPGRSREEA